MTSHYTRLTKGTNAETLKDALDALLKQQKDVFRREEEIAQVLKRLESEGTQHFSRAGILRYNPFSDTGGAQSFSMALLNGVESGIVITSLFARTGNRWFVKEVVNGKGKEFELSKEELAAVHRTRTDRP